MQGTEIKLGGLGINFPYTPYPIQKAMLARIAVALTNRENCLIESPTGTGKTLVLLCASLSWHRQSTKEKAPVMSQRLRDKCAEDRRLKLLSRPCSCGRRPNARTELQQLKEAKEQDKKGTDDDCCEFVAKKMKKNDQPEFIIIDSDDECQTISEPKVDEPKGDEPKEEKTVIEEEMCKNCQAIKIEDEFSEQMGSMTTPIRVGRIPRIFYGTRTHKQITQVIRELRKTPYVNKLKSCILSSRDRTCINEQIRDQPDRNDKCQELIKGNRSSKSSMSKSDANKPSCQYYRDSNNMSAEFERIFLDHADDAWDIEDSVNFGKTNCVCPYYGARSIQDQADITFCPYNYLLDPNIRKAMNINLNNSVIIFDEAHNIEDICRDSASLTLNTQKIDEITLTIGRTLPNFLQGSKISDAYYFFKYLFDKLKNCLRGFVFDPVKDVHKEGDCINRHTMQHHEMLNFLEEIGLGRQVLKEIKENLNVLRGPDESENGEKTSDDIQDSALSNNQMQDITQLVHTLEFIHDDKRPNSADYRCIVSELIERVKTNPRNNTLTDSTNQTNNRIHQLSLVCMNSGLAFERIHQQAWSVIVASGTLSPIESLKTELGCKFAQVFEGSHVISDDRIFATVLSRGPHRVDLNCSYQNSLKFDFQDEVGSIIRDVCRTVPNGVLVFFPSYDRQENLYQRWFTKGLIQEIQASGKKLFREQRNYTAAKFEEELQKYHRAAKGRGALLFAVFRGKASEGIDFSDTAARAVITLGIPYPNVKEITIALKRDYNDMARRDKPFLMTGRDWYASQAFRALNQALGRCIRHKDDWGAIIMIDSRLRDQTSINNISKWIRRVVTMPNDYSLVKDALEDFVGRLSIN